MANPKGFGFGAFKKLILKRRDAKRRIRLIISGAFAPFVLSGENPAWPGGCQL
jgi:hypothetical protein